MAKKSRKDLPRTDDNNMGLSIADFDVLFWHCTWQFL